MSILLDSLKHKNDAEKLAVPSVHDSHFDDEMLNDDELIKSNQFWKLLSGILLIILIMSWVYFIIQNPNKYNPNEIKSLNRSSEAEKNIQISELSVNNKSQTSESILTNEDNSKISNAANNNLYKPKKRESIEEVTTNIIEKNSVIQQEKIKQNSSLNQTLKADYSELTTINYEELPTNLLAELPSLEISSYAVSSNPKKSFIVLNSSFYSIDDTIAPNLKLLSIEKQNVLFKYKDILIKKKYK